MEESSGWKLFQKRIYDILSHRHGTIILICGCILVIVSAFQFGEAFLEWSEEKYATVFNSFSDNVAGRSFRKRLCLPVPIDVVYTWVNGSDPQLIFELRKYKRMMEIELNQTTKNFSGECMFSNCIPTVSMVIDPSLPFGLTKETLGIIYPALKKAADIYSIKDPQNENLTVTVVEFEKEESLKEAIKKPFIIDGKNATIKQAYYTSDWTIPSTVLLPNMVLLSGFPHKFSEDDLKNHLPKKNLPFVKSVEIHSAKGIAVITMTNKEEGIKFIEEGNVTIEGKQQQLNPAYLVWDLRDYTLEDDIAPSRFEDNEELRYSMRSIEQNAPWVRQIFLLTNGQIPYWLNLDNPRLTVVTHNEIFDNKSHLPSFSSPSIETHLHKIPGLSDKFIYMNDDVMFGKEVWPDDFYTHSKGQKVYLTWPVPSCQDGCPSTWIKDGYCDKACNNTECEWDGGDCIGANAQNQGVGWGGAWNMGDSHGLYCSSGCASNWLADRYCDTSCNVIQCGFDAGDCGTDNYNQLHEVVLNRNVTHYVIPKGEYIAYMNISTLFGPGCSVTEGTYDENNVLRTLAIAQKFHVVTIVLHEGKNVTSFNMTFKGKAKDSDKVLQFNCTITVDTTGAKKVESKLESKAGDVKANKTSSDNKTSDAVKDAEEKFVFHDIPMELRNPKAKRSVVSEVQPKIIQVNMTQYMLPTDIEDQLGQLIKEHNLGLLTNKGFHMREASLWETFLQRMKLEGKQPVKKPPAPVNTTRILSVKQQGNISKSKLQQVDQKLNADQENVKAPEKVGNIGVQQADKEMSLHEQKKNLNVGEQHAGNENLQINDDLHGGNKEIDNNVNEPRLDDTNVVKHDDQQQDDVQNILQDINIEPVAQKDSSHNLQKEKISQEKNIDGKVIGDNVDLKVDDNVAGQYKINNTHKSRTLNSLDDGAGFLPWEKVGYFNDIQKKLDENDIANLYDSSFRRRNLLDHYSDSLRFVNKLFNADYGYQSRKVPAHMPHLVDKHVMYELQNKYSKQWKATSSHKVRHSQDMQFSFTYFYYLMSEPNKFDTGDIFDTMDTDNSGILSDREIRTLATRLYDLPLDLPTLTGVETLFKECAENHPEDPQVKNMQREAYYDNTMPQVTKSLFQKCPKLEEEVKKKFHPGTKYKYELGSEEEITFKMIKTNVSSVVGQLDDVRKKPTKFICLNDNIHHHTEEAKTVKAVLQDFYESIFPIPSSFELPREYRNRFLHIDDLKDWKKYRDWLKLWTQIALFLLVMFTLASFFSDKLEALQRKIFGRRQTFNTVGRKQKPLESV